MVHRRGAILLRKARIMYRMRCSEIWGGFRDHDADLATSGIVASLYSGSCRGGKGGDLYYFSVCDSDLLTRIAVADVMGHGEEVSEVSRWVYDSLRARMNDADGSTVLGDLNRRANAYGDQAMTTAAVVAFYRRTSNLYFSYAGHPPILIRRRSDPHWWHGEVDSRIDLANMPLGVQSDTVYEQRAVPFSRGDRAFLYTDGVIEAPDPSGQLFGMQRLLDVLEGAADEDLPQLKNAVLGALRRHTGGALNHDDVTLMAIEVA
jgi:sigma-B regulation protein RsbU (phosphoserine phosphatase)